MNAKASRLLEAFASLPHGSTIVEIGSARYHDERPSDGHSTFYLAQAAREHGWAFHSVDCDRATVLNAASVIAGLPGTVHHGDGEYWLRMYRHTALIDGLYLDGSAAPVETLDQYHAASLARTAVVVIDDVQPIGDVERGKGDRLLDHLERDGFSVEISATEPGYEMAVARRPGPCPIKNDPEFDYSEAR